MRIGTQRLLLGLLLSLGAGTAPAQEARPTEPDASVVDLLERGKRLYGNGKLDAAFDAFSEVLKVAPENLAALHHLARIHALEGRYRQAIGGLRKLQRLGVSIYRSKDSETTLKEVIRGVVSLDDLKRRADLLVHLRETLHGLPVSLEHRIDAHLMGIYAKRGERHLHEVVRARYFRAKPVTATAYFTAARTYLAYGVNLDDAARFFERGIDVLEEKEDIRPSGNPQRDELRRRIVEADITSLQDFLAYAYHAAGMDTPEENRLMAAEPQPGATFADVTAQAGLDQVAGARIAVGDYDGDGFEDLCIAGRLFKSRDGKTFAEVTQEAGIDPRGTISALWLDYDNDGRIDLLLSALPRMRLWRNLDGATFEDVTQEAGLDVPMPGAPEALGAADYDGDGYLDLFVGCFEHPDPRAVAVGQRDFLFRNTGQGGFEDASERAGLRLKQEVRDRRSGDRRLREARYCARGCAWGDFNNDGFPDLYVANYRLHPNQLWVNQGNGKFLERAAELGVRGTPGPGRFAPALGHSIAPAWGDLDGDLDLDLVVTNFCRKEFLRFADPTVLYVNSGPDGGWKFAEVARSAGIRFEEMTAGVSLCDYDNDGDLDIYLSAIFKERPAFLYQNAGDATFQPVTWKAGALAFATWGQAWLDKDNDGDMDLVVGSRTGVHLFENQGNANAWLGVRLVGKLSNRLGVGARVTVSAGTRQLIREVRAGSGCGCQSSPILHFGLGDHQGPLALTVRWPSGRIQRVAGVEGKKLVTVEEE
ncbi:MAG: FG-GAP-like repeat-containing protein [Candidatus Brocadiia bacterium]